MEKRAASSAKVIALAFRAFQYLADNAVQGAMRFARRSGRFEFRDLVYLDESEIISRLKQVRPDGAIISLPKTTFNSIRTELPSGLPMVNIGAEWLGPGVPGICNDDRAVVELAASHLHEHGYECIGFVGMCNSDASERRSQVLKKLEARCSIYELPWPQDDSEGAIVPDAALKRWLNSLPRPAGIITWNGYFARCVCKAIHQLQLEVPQDIGVVSLVDERHCLFGDPPVTAVDSGGNKLGYEAMKLLTSILDGRPSPTKQLIHFAPRGMVVRESTKRTRDEEQDQIGRALAYIDEHFCQGIDVNDVYKATQTISRTKFYDDFTRRVGRSPAEHICRLKLVRARELLAESTLSITRIAGMCGFQSGTRFGDTFRKQVGATPRAYRRKHGKQKPIASKRKTKAKRKR